MSKIRTLGVYVGLAVDPAVDWEKVCKDAADAGYTSISVHLTSAFFNVGLWPWVCVNGKFDFTKINPDYRIHFRRACDAAAANKIALHLCFVDQFHDKGDNPNPDPFRQGLGMGDGWDEEPLYSSITFGPTKFWWLKWDEDPKIYAETDKTIAQFKPFGAFGNGMARYIDMIINVCRNVKLANPTAPEPTWKWGNETLAMKYPDHNPVNKRGDRDEVVIWLGAKWKKAGFGNNCYFDYICVNAGKHKTDTDYVAYDVVRDAFKKGVRGKHHAKLEVHGVLNEQQAARFDLDNRFVKFSTDGDLLMTGDYVGLGKGPLPDVDLKMDSKKVTESTAMEFFNGLMGKYRQYVDKQQ